VQRGRISGNAVAGFWLIAAGLCSASGPPLIYVL